VHTLFYEFDVLAGGNMDYTTPSLVFKALE
jgi:hypothetical protein